MALIRQLENSYRISDDPAELDHDAIHAYISGESYWAAGRARDLTEAAIAGSLCLGVYAPDGSQAGFARVVTDRATAAHLSDVFVLPAHRRQGLGEALIAALLEHPDLVTVRRWTLSTRDAHGLYAKFGFTAIDRPESEMIRRLQPPGTGRD